MLRHSQKEDEETHNLRFGWNSRAQQEDPDFAKRRGILAILDAQIPQFSARMGGPTSIDVTNPGIDKGYGIRKPQATLGIP
jgi:hypothetical protein